jgi:hypothetical protein
MKTIIVSLASLTLGMAITLSCSDDSPGDADAAVCDCPAAEPPITAQRMVRETSNPLSITAGTSSGPAIACSRGIAVSGSCDLEMNAMRSQFRLVEAGLHDSNGWSCRWYNGGATDATATATVVCLVPAT